MKVFAGLLVAALGIAALAVVLDSPLLVLLSVVVIGCGMLSALAVGLRSAHQQGFVAAFVGVLLLALTVAALGVAAVVVGERGNAPGLVLLGVALVTSVVVGAVSLGAKPAPR